jgi:hypothetical protein
MHTHMLKVLTRGRLVAFGNKVLAANLQRIDIELARDLVDMGLQGEHGLRLSRSTHEATRDGIGVDERRRDLTVRHAIGTRSLVIAINEATRFEGRIGPGIDQVVHLVGY